jgi:primosomal protein N' (replication factor Y)
MRWDRDVTRTKDSHDELLQRFADREVDVMVGTQMVAKGLDLPFVTLVGVVTADTALNLPDLRAAERTFQLLTQVAGRAGRSVLGGRVVVQTYMPSHYAVQTASRHDYEAFYESEIAFRRENWYPPFSRLIRLLCSHSSDQRCQEECRRMYALLSNRLERLGLPEIDLLGPSPCFISRVRGKYRWQIIVRGRDPQSLVEGAPRPLGWSVDVDPVSTL